MIDCETVPQKVLPTFACSALRIITEIYRAHVPSLRCKTGCYRLILRIKTEKIAKKPNKKSSHSEKVINAPASTGRKKRRSAGAREQPRA